MKTRKIRISFIMIIILSLIFGLNLLNSCKKDVEILPRDGYYKVIGKIINQITGEPIENARIVVQSQNGNFKTDNNGNFTVYVPNEQDYSAFVIKNGFVNKAFKIGNFPGGFFSKLIKLKPLEGAENIGLDGGAIETINNCGNTVEINIPIGTLNSSENISLTPLWGTEMPRIDLNSKIPLETMLLSPMDINLNKDVEIIVELPIDYSTGFSSDFNPIVMKYNFESGIWNIIPIETQVVGLTTIFHVSSFGLYSLVTEGDFTEEIINGYSESVGVDEAYSNIFLMPSLVPNTEVVNYKFFEGLENQYYQLDFNESNEFLLSAFDYSSGGYKSTNHFLYDICWKTVTNTVGISFIGVATTSWTKSIPYPCNIKWHNGGHGHK